MPDAQPNAGVSIGSRLRAWVAFVLGLMLLAPPAMAQYYGGQRQGYGFNPDQNLFQPSPAELYAPRVGIIAAGIAFGFIVGAFFSPLLARVRRYLFLAAVALGILFAMLGPFPVADAVAWFIALVAGIAAFAAGLRLGRRVIERIARRATSYGSAKWADLPYLQQHGIIGRTGFTLGEFPTAGEPAVHPLHYEGARHLLTVAPTRSGKGVSSIIPNLLTYPGSARRLCQDQRCLVT